MKKLTFKICFLLLIGLLCYDYLVAQDNTSEPIRKFGIATGLQYYELIDVENEDNYEIVGYIRNNSRSSSTVRNFQANTPNDGLDFFEVVEIVEDDQPLRPGDKVLIIRYKLGKSDYDAGRFPVIGCCK